MMHSAGASLLQIIDDILDFSKIEAGKMEISPTSFDPGELLGAVSGLLGPKADEKGLTLSVEADFALPPRVWGDSLRLQQVLMNLVGNALKFTSQGQVRVEVSRKGATDEVTNWEFRVIDTGLGLTADQISRLFRPFEQAETETTRLFGGTGLGLSICKRLVELMGGEIGVESRSREGSCFWFRVPIKELQKIGPQTPSPPTPTLGRLEGYHILLVEDTPIKQVVARTMLRSAGAEVEVANDGSQCLEILKKNPDKYNVVLMDVQMPVMNGFEATLAIRHDLDLAVPIIALTAGVMDEEREKCLAIGMNGLIPKPIEKAVLLQLLRSLVVL
jgi:CheY-like chemotaxis protein